MNSDAFTLDVTFDAGRHAQGWLKPVGGPQLHIRLESPLPFNLSPIPL